MSIDSTGIGSATPLDTKQKWQVIKDQVGLDNTDDYYSFKLSGRSSFNLTLSSLSANADVRLLNDSGAEIANSSNQGKVSEKINQVLDAGSYHIQVHQVGNAGTNYSLQVRSNYIPQGFQFSTAAIAGGIRLTDTKVFDADGVNDIRAVDFWLKKQGESWKKIDTVSELDTNSDGSISFKTDISNLEAGKYDIWGRATDTFGAISNGWKETFAVKPKSVNVAPANLGFAIAEIDAGIKLTNTKVFDADGIDDLKKVDFQLKKDGGEWVDIQDAVDFRSNQDGSIGFEYSISGLAKGSYELIAAAYDQAGAKGDDLKSFFQVKNAAPTDLQFEIATVGRGIRLIDTKVFDANGIDDLSRVDFWLKKDNGNWIDIADAMEFRSNQDGISFDYSIDSLTKGNYQLWARTRDRANDYSNAWQKSFTIENVAPSQLSFNVKQINGGIELVGAKVFDADGINDLARVDFQLKKEGGTWIDIQDALNFSTNQDTSIGFNYSIKDLKAGDYELRAIVYDQAGAAGDALTTYFKVANFTPAQLEFDVEAVEGGVRVINTKVFDANGIDDLSRIDFWLQKEGGSWTNIADGLEFRSNTDGSFSFDYSVNSLKAGNYLLWATARDKTDAYSNSWQKSFQVEDSQPQTDWFDQNIQDTSIRTLTRSLFADQNIDRNDAIAILRDAKDNGVVDVVEINDLRTIINNASYLGMTDYVRVLSNKVVNGDVANQGNLLAGSSDVQLDRLINKWFLGSERPTTNHTYQYAQGSLFQNGISHDDIRQGYINDCFFLAGLAATVVQSPNTIQNMFIDNGDNTFTIRFHNKGVADYVTVDRYLPTNNIGNFVYANAGDYHGNSNNELWVALAEKAYAQLNESGWINQNNTNSYDGIGNAGYLSDAFAHITGEKSALGRSLNFNTVINTFNSGEVVGFGSKSTGVTSNIVASHAYALVDYNSTTQKFTLLNPWSTDNSSLKSRTLELSWAEISSNFSYWDSTISQVVST